MTKGDDWDDPLSDAFEDDDEEQDEELEEEHDSDDDSLVVEGLDEGDPVEDDGDELGRGKDPRARSRRRRKQQAKTRQGGGGQQFRVVRMPPRMAKKFRFAESILITKRNGRQVMFIR